MREFLIHISKILLRHLGSKEEISIIFQYSEHGGEPTGSMGDDTPLAQLVRKYDLFMISRQKFAQVTNPPIDFPREISNVSGDCIGPELNIFEEKLNTQTE